MDAAEARVLILEGDDEFAIAQKIAHIQAELEAESASFFELNLAHLDGATFNLDKLPSIAGALPFMARRRLVILANMLGKLPQSEDKGGKKKTSPTQVKLFQMLEQIPESTLLILVVSYDASEAWTDEIKRKLSSLRQWARENSQTAQLRTFTIPKGEALARRIQQLAKDAGGEIRIDAALQLANLVDDDPRRAAQELEKILARINYARRPITIEDVVEATPDDNQGGTFALTDALAEGRIHEAVDQLQRMLEYEDFFKVFSAITGHFRKLIFTREVIDRGGGLDEIKKTLQYLGVRSSYPVEKFTRQARRLTMDRLENAYKLLLEVDRAKKLSLASDAMLLDFFASAFSFVTGQHVIPEAEPGVPIDSVYRY